MEQVENCCKCIHFICVHKHFFLLQMLFRLQIQNTIYNFTQYKLSIKYANEMPNYKVLPIRCQF